MSRFLGDIPRLTVHDTGHLSEVCGIEGLPGKHRMDIYSTELLQYLVRAENWHCCEYCVANGLDDAAHERFHVTHPVGERP